MRGLTRMTLCTVATAVGVVVVTAAERWWNGDRTPRALWITTAFVTSIALTCPRTHRRAVVAGGAIGSVVAALWLRDSTLRDIVTVVAACTAEVVVVVVLSERWLPAGPSIRRTRNAQTFFGIAVLAGAAGATVAALDTASLIADTRFESWWRWMLAATVGQLIGTPVALTRQARLITSAHGRQLTELVLTVIELAVLTGLALLLGAPLLFTTVPLVMWLAIRFGPRVTAPVSVAMAIAVTAASTHGSGPFASPGATGTVQMQLFCMSIALSSLIAGGHALRARRDHARLAGILAAIPDIVLVRDERGQVIDSWVPYGQRDAADSLAPGAADTPSIIDDEPSPVEESVLVEHVAGSTFERRTAVVRGQRTVEFYRDVTEERRALTELRRREEAIEDARTAEQSRIARAIHDSPLQLLAAAKMRIESAGADVGDDDVAALLGGASELIAQSMIELRGQLDALTPPDVTAGAVVPALAHLARRVLEPGVTVRAHQETVTELDGQVSSVLFQAGREALANVAKHAGASTVHIELVEDDGVAVLTVRDDGVGPTVSVGDRRHIGLALMRERVDEAGGWLRLVQRSGAGTELSVGVPVAMAG